MRTIVRVSVKSHEQLVRLAVLFDESLDYLAAKVLDLGVQNLATHNLHASYDTELTLLVTPSRRAARTLAELAVDADHLEQLKTIAFMIGLREMYTAEQIERATHDRRVELLRRGSLSRAEQSLIGTRP